MDRLSRILLSLLFLLAPVVKADSGPSVTADQAVAPIRLDGRLDEAAWQQAGVVAELTQQSPSPGKATPFRTEVRVLIVKDTLYFGFLCTDPEPSRIAIHSMQRDGNMEGDDTVGIVLDTYGDKRTGYAFKVNAAGARADGLISDPENIAPDWDGIWDARTARTATGWSAEIEIPGRTLSFTPGLKSWGLNLERMVARERLVLRWASPTLDSFAADLSRAGSLAGVENLRQGRGLEFTPYLAGRMRKEFGSGSRVWQAAEGMDFSWRITPQLAAVFTANTDFAETEVDERQVNLTRFPLFFPEKRAFFLEGSNQFNFGLGLGNNFIPFFTRRVGLVEGYQVPIDAGVKLNGRVGHWNLGLLDVQTRRMGLLPATNLFAGRASYDVSNSLRVGALVTHGDPEGVKRNTLAGFDAVWRTSTFRRNKNLQIGGWTALTAGDRPQGRRTGWGYKVDYPNDLFDCYVQTNQFGDALNPSLGYLPRPGTRQWAGGCALQPRPSRDGRLAWIRQASIRNYYTRVTNLNGTNESWRYNFSPLSWELNSGEWVQLSWVPQYELLTAPFRISRGVTIRPGSYRFDRFGILATTSAHRPLKFYSFTWLGSFYSGNLRQYENSVFWTSPKGRLQLGTAVTNNYAHLREGNLVQRLWQQRVTFAWSPNLVLSSFIQYDSDSGNVGTNTRLRWTIKPGRELFVVWNRGWQRLLERPELALIPDNEVIAIKLRWTFRM